MQHSTRIARKGGALAAAMLFFVVVTVAGAALLSVSMITQESIIRSGYDVKLLIAAEAGLETIKGRFTLKEGVLEDWSQLLPNPSDWNTIGAPMTINGIPVQAQGISVGTPAVPRARVRAVATLWNRRRVVEYIIRVPSFSDFALYDGSTAGWSIPENTKVWGNIYGATNINLSNRAGIEFFMDVSTSGTVQNAPDPVYNFKQGYQEFVPSIQMPPTINGMDIMANVASTLGHYYYRNTKSIRFLPGNLYERVYTYVGLSGDELRTSTQPVPDDGVIFVSTSAPPAGVDTSGAANSASYSPLQFVGGVLGVPGMPANGARVTLAHDGRLDLIGSMAYQSLLENPDLRRIENKKSDAALAYREMLGVVASGRFRGFCGDWPALPSALAVSGHLSQQVPLDGVFMSTDRLVSSGSTSNPSQRELWLNGGLISGVQNLDMLASHFGVLNYHTDWRLQYTMPPYFLRAYGDAVVMERGSWRTYELP